MLKNTLIQITLILKGFCNFFTREIKKILELYSCRNNIFMSTPLNDLFQVNSSPGNEGVVYSLSWAPGDLNCIVASTSKHGMFIWDIGKGRIIQRFQDVSSVTYCVACPLWRRRHIGITSVVLQDVSSVTYCVACPL